MVALFVMSLSIGCSDPAIDDLDTPPPVEQLYPKLVNGRVTAERPEVGLMLMGGGMCTATLVAADVAITAAHCIDYRTAQNPGHYGEFVVQARVGTRRYPIGRGCAERCCSTSNDRQSRTQYGLSTHCLRLWMHPQKWAI